MFNWYRLFSEQEFEDIDIPSKEFDVDLGTLGTKTIMVTKGNRTSILVDNIFLSIGLNEKNPFRYGDRAVYLDDNGDVWLGVYVAD